VISPRVRAALAYAALYAAVGSMLPYMPLYYRSLGFSLGEVGSILALSALVGLLASPGWGALSDRQRGSPLVLVAAAATALAGAGLLSLSTTPFIVIAGAALVGTGLGGLSPIIDARALDAAGANRSELGPLRAWGSLSYIVAVLGSGILVDNFGLRSMFVVLAATLVLTAIVGLGLKPPSSRPFQAASSPLRDAGRLFGPRGLGLFLLGAFLTWVGMSAVLTFTPIRFAELGAGASIVGLGGAIAAGTEVPLMLRFPSLAKRWGSNRLLIAGSAFTAARAIVAAFSTDANVLLAASLFGGLGYAFFAIGGITYVSEHVPRELAATAQGIFQGVGNSLAQVTAAALGGAVAAFAGVAGLFAVAAVVGIGAAAILWLAIRRGVGGGMRGLESGRDRDETSVEPGHSLPLQP
jgi:MFS transporter, PPP family, 3-phenylpropionic acid transporter